MRRFALLLLLQTAYTGLQLHAQAFLKMAQPLRTEINTGSSKHYWSGRTCTGCKVLLNNDSIRVYPNGVFAIKRELKPGKNLFVLSSTDSTGKFVSRTYNVYFTSPPPVRVTPSFRIDYVNISPKTNTILSAGDTLRVRMKGYPGGQASWFNGRSIPELPAGQSGGIPGFYAGYYVLTEADSLLNGKVNVYLKDRGQTAVLPGNFRYTYQRNTQLVGRTIDDMTYLTISPDGDRLGPEKIGYLDRDVLLHITGKEGSHYRVKLSKSQFAYIPEALVDTMTLTEQVPQSIADDVRVWSDKQYDYISVGLAEKLPYLSTQEVNPGKITVDIHGAISEPGFLPTTQSTGEISRIDWQQVSPDVFRVAVSLVNKQPWGYKIYYADSNRLTIRIRHQPANLQLKGMTIGLDAGHGGGNVGTAGAMGIAEKQLALNLSLLVKAALEKEGARVITTRMSDMFVDNQARLYNYRQLAPDLLLSIHMNSSVNPVDIKGTANYYKYPFCEPLNRFIHNRLLETGLADFKNNANFNFILNMPTEMPSALIETLFLSSPEDEMRILDEQFRLVLADKIVQGLKDFLQDAAK
ncbi:N-acetylmuramoyl-L-alanine amidase [Chitinophaga rhizophila]|uniref:N-acetylmuramoyl-L-alanine amidase n=1 Tax=Chitinophaga rhizophila TaxID=2866212 RepID=A0ABS7GFD5_9BACT|nr:N-acetylmuramoyl-L-alanine amidase [Chitinophaga rhizophila]MBW8686394.1 N-acetylmuramoyl-L-alanine amidase [Chitinophaga rhizophila]